MRLWVLLLYLQSLSEWKTTLDKDFCVELCKKFSAKNKVCNSIIYYISKSSQLLWHYLNINLKLKELCYALYSDITNKIRAMSLLMILMLWFYMIGNKCSFDCLDILSEELLLRPSGLHTWPKMQFSVNPHIRSIQHLLP